LAEVKLEIAQKEITMARIPLGIESDAAGNYPQAVNKREQKILEAMREDRNIALTFKQAVVTSRNDSVGAILPTENAAAVVAVHDMDGVKIEQYMSVVESTGTALYLFPYVSADGLELPLDANVTDGPTAYELTPGILARNPGAYTVGSLPGGNGSSVYVEADIIIDDISDLDQLIVGFRKLEAYQADPNDYDELAALHVGETGATVEDGRISVMKILNAGATSFTDTAVTDWADAAQKKLRVEVRNDGVCTFKIAGTATVVTSMTFDAAEVIIPFIYVDNATGSTTGDPGITLVSFKAGVM
jgi:hypothetical protein